MRVLLANVPSEKLDVHPDPDRFSIREEIAHLADWEPIMLGRLRQGVEEDYPEITVYDESQRAIEFNYAAQDVWVSLDKWAALREQTVAFVKSLNQEQFARPMNHPERGTLSVKDYANMLLAHDVYHLEHVSDAVAGKVAGTW